MLANIAFICTVGPMLSKVKDNSQLLDMARKQSTGLTTFNKALGIDSRDKFKVAYDQRQIDIAAGATNLPPLKQM